ncbi:hypothetical protein C7M84_022323 [Penaeus vannamei]|uniref:Uncharacterized protein n=1 Tax=Penaeus vannamei TaxID=6689 RepID=A0A3R7PF00_PENVA|nr:hypothetical protein C7M84_022323 [Penaeus vannamei]
MPILVYTCVVEEFPGWNLGVCLHCRSGRKSGAAVGKELHLGLVRKDLLESRRGRSPPIRMRRKVVKKVLSVEQAEGRGARVRRSIGRKELKKDARNIITAHESAGGSLAV